MKDDLGAGFMKQFGSALSPKDPQSMMEGGVQESDAEESPIYNLYGRLVGSLPQNSDLVKLKATPSKMHSNSVKPNLDDTHGRDLEHGSVLEMEERKPSAKPP